MTTFDEHVDEVLALIAPDRSTAARPRPGQPARAPKAGRPRLVLVRCDSEGTFRR
ncbi:hypothetical protein ABZ896_22825 [Streptomyces sp. NPDC047072]|uniref:hypothetical protein n=1 Tax=Streptomyces sp. NPDC047072 TaxID=3154809 RepID=UPI0033D4C15D